MTNLLLPQIALRCNLHIISYSVFQNMVITRGGFL